MFYCWTGLPGVGRKKRYKDKPAAPMFSLVKSWQSYIMRSVNTEKVKVSAFTRSLVSSDCPFCRAADNNMVPKPRCNLAKELQEA